MAPGSLNNVVDGVGIVYGRGSVSCAANRQRSLRRQSKVDFLMSRKWVVAAALHRYLVDQEMGGLMLFHALLVKLFKRVFVSGLAWFCYVSFKEMVSKVTTLYSYTRGIVIALSITSSCVDLVVTIVYYIKPQWYEVLVSNGMVLIRKVSVSQFPARVVEDRALWWFKGSAFVRYSTLDEVAVGIKGTHGKVIMVIFKTYV
ncbi:hypothetical protein E3N88_32587 [Mikania micrantha]|uniref:RRM domain-containing protein n=1 Tax=Mikania micrantha TaxID=192012 RepID=A0A5N6M9D7_9ASTR|nr:hypothetical protein E3N88_32587 [Mikania micrantha]